MIYKYATFGWFDTTDIEVEHDRIVAQSDELRNHVNLVHVALQTLHVALRRLPYQGNDETLTLLRVANRIFNASGAALKSARAGWFQPAFAMVRDLLEMEFLADLFCRDRRHLQRWMSLDAKSRKREFQPVKVRAILDDLDGYKKQRRREVYELFSKHAAHLDPDGFHIISPGNMTQIGPFPSEPALSAFLEELAIHLHLACVHLLTLLPPLEGEVAKAQEAFAAALSKWKSMCIPGSPR